MDTVLFDLDGTLLPMEQEAFLRRYIGLLSVKAAAHGIEPQAMVKALWRGTTAMMNNDGTQSNRQCFWDNFARDLGQEIRALEPVFDGFYCHEFDKARDSTKPNPLARQALDLLHAKGYTLALATNPLFPAVAIDTRLKWVGLNRADFAYISDYQNSNYCKPNHEYFRAVLGALGKNPPDALMVGNNIKEDMAAKELGLAVYLITDCLEGEGDHSLFPQGSFKEFVTHIEQMPAIR